MPCRLMPLPLPPAFWRRAGKGGGPRRPCSNLWLEPAPMGTQKLSIIKIALSIPQQRLYVTIHTTHTVGSAATFDVSATGLTLASGKTLAGNGTVIGAVRSEERRVGKE